MKLRVQKELRREGVDNSGQLDRDELSMVSHRAIGEQGGRIDLVEGIGEVG